MEMIALVVVGALVLAALVIAGGGMDRTRRRRRTVVVDRPVERVVERPARRRVVERDVVDAIDQFDSELTVRARSCTHAEAAAAESLITTPITTERNPS